MKAIGAGLRPFPGLRPVPHGGCAPATPAENRQNLSEKKKTRRPGGGASLPAFRLILQLENAVPPLKRSLLFWATAVLTVYAQGNAPSSGQVVITLADRIDLSRPSIVRILPSFGGSGTGFFVNNKGNVVSARHVFLKPPDDSLVMNGHTIEVRRPGTSGGSDADFFSVSANIVGEDPTHDLVVLEPSKNPFTNITSLSFARIDDSRRRQGEEIFIPGYAFGGRNILSVAGIVSMVDTPPLFNPLKNVSDYVYFAAFRSYEGHSGSPVFLTQTGSVVGVLRGDVTDYVRLKGRPGVVAAGLGAVESNNAIDRTPGFTSIVIL